MIKFHKFGLFTEDFVNLHSVMTDIHTIRRALAPDLESINSLIADRLSSTNPLINEVIGRYLSHKGKQLRPMMVVLTARLLGAAVTDRVIASAASIEMLHNASLIHDDVIDQSSTRHNAPTINAMWDNHIAVLVGDYFVSSALQLVISTADLRAIETIASLGRLLSTGEMDQIHNAANNSISEESYFEIITHKTASLFVACVEMGAYAADADSRKLDIMRRFALLFGQCFQIKDDIFDYFHSDSLGKPTGNDLREGKVTLPLIHALGRTDYPGCRDVASLLARPAQAARLYRQCFTCSGGKFGNVLCEFALEVGGFVFADSFFAGQTVEDSYHFGVESESFGLVGELTQLTNGVARCLGIVAVAQTAGFGLADALFR